MSIKQSRIKKFLNEDALVIERKNKNGVKTLSINVSTNVVLAAAIPMLIIPPAMVYIIGPAVEGIKSLINLL